MATPLTVLVADDNPDAVDTLAQLLRFRGHIVHTATDGRSALEVANHVHPDVSLLDIGMPRMTGHEVAKQIRATPWGSDVLLVAVSAWGERKDKARAHDAGFDHHVTKPAEFDEIVALVENAERHH